MKTVVAIIILAIIMSAGIVETIYIENTFAELNERLEIMKTFILKEEVSNALKATEDTIEWWERKKGFMEFFTVSADLRLLSVSLGEIKGSLLMDDNNNAMSKTESIFEISDNLREILNFNLKDIV